MKKKNKQKFSLVAIGVALIGIISYTYYIDKAAEETREKGRIFGIELEQIQNEVKDHQTNFANQYVLLNETKITKEEFLKFSETHVLKFEKMIPRYDNLDPPESFIPAVKFFELSTESQIESDKQYILWIKTGDESYKTRSDSLLQESFDYEGIALAEFNAAKRGASP